MLLALGAARARAQSFEAGIHFASAQWSEFDGNDLGIGGRVTWMPSSMLGLDADITWYPSDFPPDTVVPFSGRRVEGLFGATAGPTLGRIRPFAKAAAGFRGGRDADHGASRFFRRRSPACWPEAIRFLRMRLAAVLP